MHAPPLVVLPSTPPGGRRSDRLFIVRCEENATRMLRGISAKFTKKQRGRDRIVAVRRRLNSRPGSLIAWCVFANHKEGTGQKWRQVLQRRPLHNEFGVFHARPAPRVQEAGRDYTPGVLRTRSGDPSVNWLDGPTYAWARNEAKPKVPQVSDFFETSIFDPDSLPRSFNLSTKST